MGGSVKGLRPMLASTCAECGKRIPAGLMQHCEKGGWCSWYVPAAAYQKMVELQEILVGILENCSLVHKYWGGVSNQKEADEYIKRAHEVVGMSKEMEEK